MENHLSINNQFIHFNSALKLKDLGFNEECLMVYNDRKVLQDVGCDGCNAILQYLGHENYISAPLWQQAFQFLMRDSIPDNYRLEYDCVGWTLFDDDKNIYWSDEKAIDRLIKLYLKYEK